MKTITLTSILFLLLFARVNFAQTNWSNWQSILDLHEDGISISYMAKAFEYEGNTKAHYFKFSNQYNKTIKARVVIYVVDAYGNESTTTCYLDIDANSTQDEK